MLDPQERVVLLEALTPPEGFALDQGIGTTYSLDLITLLSTPLAFTSFEWEDAKGEMTSNPVLLLESLRRHINRLTVFCQTGRITVPPRPNPLFSYLEQCAVEVAAPNREGVFHPKVWVLRFLNAETGAVRYRFLCLSRNLTDDPCWDLSLMLEGPLVDRKPAYAVNHPLADFVKALPGLATRPVTDEVRARTELMAAELRKVDFRTELPEPFEDLAFHPMGIESYGGFPLPGEWYRGLVVSPFLDAEQAEWLARETDGSVLVSRAEELDRLPKGALEGWERVFVLASAVQGEVEPGATAEPADTERPKGLHAKLFVCENGRECRLFMGSANATTAAFERNVEFLVELVGKKSKIGVDQILTPAEGEASLLSLLQEYQPPAEPVDDSVERRLDDLLNAVRGGMTAAGWELHAGSEEGGGWRLRLVRESATPLPLADGVKLKVWPVTWPAESGAQSVDRDSREVRFPASGLGGLTTFLACEVTASHEGQSRVIRFALNLPLIGAPADRREAILRQVLDDPQKVLRFLQFLLNDETADPMGGDPGPPVEGTGAGAGAWEEGFVLLESLLRALAHEPKRLDEVAALLKELGDEEESRARIPPGLLGVWPAIWGAREGLTP